MNSGAIPNGVVATVSITLSPSASGSVSIGVSRVAAADGNARSITMSGSGGAISVWQTTVSSLKCNPAMLTPGATTTCIVSLTYGAPSGGATVTLTSNSPLLPVPQSVIVSACSTTATFTGTAGGVVTTQTTVTLGAAYNNSSQSAAVTLAPAIIISTLVCTPTSVTDGGTTNCTVTLANPAPAQVTISVSSNDTYLAVPSSAVIAQGASTTTFTGTGGYIPTNQTATVTAAYGSSSGTASISLVAQPIITNVVCSPLTLNPSGSSNCTATLTLPAPGKGLNVPLTSNNPVLNVPNAISFAGGATSATFSVKAGLFTVAQLATMTATYNGTVNVTFSLAPMLFISSLSCAPSTLTAGSAAICTATLTGTDPTQALTATISSNQPALTLPQSLSIPAGSTAASFTATASPVTKAMLALVTASFNGVSQSATLAITTGQNSRTSAAGLSCPSSVRAGARFSCTMVLSPDETGQATELRVSASSPGVRLPASLSARPGQSRLSFEVSTDRSAARQSANISVQSGGSHASQALDITAAEGPILNVPVRQRAAFGQELTFAVSASDPDGLPLILSARGVPPGANFDPGTGLLTWTPAASQQGRFEIEFTATNSAGASTAGTVVVEAGPGAPRLYDVRNAASQSLAACSPGSAAVLTGEWLGSASRVQVNGADAPILFVSSERIGFLCPEAEPGTVLSVSAETEAGMSGPAQTQMLPSAPGIFSRDGSGAGQGLVWFSGTARLASPRTYEAVGEPAQPGDSLVIETTGLDPAAPPLVEIGGVVVSSEAVASKLGNPGVYALAVTLPAGVPEGSAVPMRLLPAGNTVTIAIESGRM